jgi:hypothetical protein
MRSFTIPIENCLSTTWTKVLTKHYGVPKDRNTNVLHWKVVNYSDGYQTGNITIGKWHMPKKDNQSKLHVQSTEVGNFLPAHFVDHVLPKLFEEVKKTQVIELQEKEVRTSVGAFNCKECNFIGKSLNGLSKHARLTHKKETKAPVVNSDKSGKDNSISMEDFSVKYDMNGEVADTMEAQNVNEKKGEAISADVDPTQIVTETMIEAQSCIGNETHSKDVQKSDAVQTKKEAENVSEQKQKDDKCTNKSNLENQIKKKPAKTKSNEFSCKQCDQKFGKITQLTVHMKKCHTGVEDIQIGNALTVNTPLGTGIHFFCHCSICGDGYDGYDQLSNHEREKHNYKCEKCDEWFLTKSDLKTDYDSKHTSYLCN